MIHYEYICKEDSVTGFERILRVTNEEGFWWFLQVTGDFDSARQKAISIVNDIMVNRLQSKYCFNHHFKAI